MTETAPQADGANSILAALLAGVISQNKKFRDLCSAALKGIGGRCLSTIHDTAFSPGAKAAERARLLATAEQIGEHDECSPRIASLIETALLEMLCGRNSKLKDLAFEALRHMGPPATDVVIKWARLHFKNQNRCADLLNAAERLGHPPASVVRIGLELTAARSLRRIPSEVRQLLRIVSSRGKTRQETPSNRLSFF